MLQRFFALVAVLYFSGCSIDIEHAQGRLCSSERPCSRGRYCVLGKCEVEGLLGHWPFDERDGRTTADRSGHELSGVLFGDSRFVEDPTRGRVLELDGTDAGVEVPNVMGKFNDIQREVTVTAWTRVAILPSMTSNILMAVVARQRGSANLDSYLLGWSQSTSGLADMRGANDAGVLLMGGQVSVGAWQHLALTYDGKLMRLFVNGAPVAGGVYSEPIGPETNGLTIGFANNRRGGTEFFSGKIDDVRLFNRALSPGEIQQIAEK
jgi:hypothetical protein